MDPRTRDIYERNAREWIGARRPRAVEDGRVDRFAARLSRGDRVADLGSGPGWYAAALRERGLRALALDLSLAMLGAAREAHPELPCVCGDLALLPFARASLAGAFAINTYVHLPLAEMPAALARLHGALASDARLELTLADAARFDPSPDELRSGELERRGDGDFPGRLFSAFSDSRAASLLEGAGFADVESETEGAWIRLQARRALTLPDFIRPGLRVLVCGLNPSLYAAKRGVPFARPGNRFWPAARAAGLVEQAGDPFAALGSGLGFTDLVKRATRRASELEPDEYEQGLRRVEALVKRYRPRIVCFVGLEGWRRAVDRTAASGWIDAGFAGRPAYLMPSTSGLNAHTDLAGFVRHLQRASG